MVRATKAQDARRRLQHRRFDIVLREFHLDHEAMNGQEPMDGLRQAALPLRSVVAMISGESDHGHVAEAAAPALDAYLIKPHAEAARHLQMAASPSSSASAPPMPASVAAPSRPSR